jgi:hypothetical protein
MEDETETPSSPRNQVGPVGQVLVAAMEGLEAVVASALGWRQPMGWTRRLQPRAAARIVRTRSVIDDFFQDTRADSPNVSMLMGDVLIGKGVTREQFALFCSGFARGVRYVGDRFGMLPTSIIITDDDRNTPAYNIDRQAIVVPRQFILTCIKLQLLRQSKTEPLVLTYEHMAIMYGVEEAYHHYDITTHHAQDAIDIIGQPDGGSGYDKSPLERAAKIVVREALVAFDLLGSRVATRNVDPEDWGWYAAARLPRAFVGREDNRRRVGMMCAGRSVLAG